MSVRWKESWKIKTKDVFFVVQYGVNFLFHFHFLWDFLFLLSIQYHLESNGGWEDECS